MFDSSPSEEISDSTFHINDLIFLFDVRSCLVYLNGLIILCDNVFGLVHNMYITIVNVLSKHLTMYNTYVMFTLCICMCLCLAYCICYAAAGTCSNGLA